MTARYGAGAEADSGAGGGGGGVYIRSLLLFLPFLSFSSLPFFSVLLYLSTLNSQLSLSFVSGNAG